MASNHLVALLGQVERLAAHAGVPFEAFLPLVTGTVENVDELGPAGALTGPVARGDDETVARHVDALPDDERDTYEALVREARRLAGQRDADVADAPRGDARMIVVDRIAEVRDLCDAARRAGQTVGLVPTMGFFHEGHRSLMRAARADHDLVVTTIFVNPLQFGANEDLAAYPRDLVADTAAAEAEGVDVLFVPSVRRDVSASRRSPPSTSTGSPRGCAAPPVRRTSTA